MKLSLRAAAVGVAALVLGATWAAKSKGDCTDPMFAVACSGIRATMSECEAATGVVMQSPMKNQLKVAFCTKCPELHGMQLSESLPACNVTTLHGNEIHLQTAFNRFFSQCNDSSSDSSSSGSNKEGGETAAPSAAAATTTITTTTTAVPVSTVETPTTKAPKTSKPAVTTPEAPQSSSAAVDAPGSKSSSSSPGTQSTSNSTDSSSTTQTAAENIVAVGLFVTRWNRGRRRSHSDSDKDYDDISVLQAPSTAQASGAPYQFSFITTSTGTSGGKPSLVSTPMANLWEDEVIVASRIPKDKVMPTVLLSRGGFGEVYQGIYNREPVAIKTLLPEHRKNMKQINAFLYEVKLMASLEHDRIVNFIGVAWDSLNDVCVVSEYMEGGDLRGVLINFEQMGRRHGFDNEKIKIALHVAHALTYLHSLRPLVLHRDLKSKNILLDSQLNAKLTDFGVSRERSDTTTMTAGVGTSLWMAPEVMMGERYDDKADIFSFGVVLSELDTHSVPYGQVKETESGRRIPDSAVLQMVSLGRLKVKFTTEGSIPEMIELGNACVALNPRDRPNAADALYTLHNILKSMFAVM